MLYMRFVLVYDADNPKNQSDHYQIIRAYHSDVNQAIQKALEVEGHQVFQLEVTQNLEAKLKAIQPDFAFNCSIKRQEADEVAFAPKVLKSLQIPFTGSSALACQNAYSKYRSKQIMRLSGVRTSRSRRIQKPDDYKLPITLAFPIFIKPERGGCSFGIGPNSLVNEEKNLKKKMAAIYKQVKQPLLLEEFLDGREFTVGVLGNESVQVLPIMEFLYKDAKEQSYRSYALKMVHYEDEDLLCPAVLTRQVQQEIETIARSAFQCLGCRDYARVDIRMDANGVPYVLEVNAHPNLMPGISSFGIMAEKGGLSFDALIKYIVEIAVRRYSMQSL